MVTRKQMVEISTRHDTQVAAAFRRALGVLPGRPRRRSRRRPHRPHQEWRGMRECFRNHGSPLDSGRM